MKFSGTTHIGVCLDRSGSMQPLVDDTIGGFNTWLAETRKAAKGQDVRLTLQQFDNEHLWPYINTPIENVRKLNTRTYVPRGSTALRDAIGLTIGKLEEAMTRKDRALVVILTDGMENASIELSAAQLEQLIAQCEKRKNWNFTYLAANQDAFAVGHSLGFRRASTISTQPSPGGTRSAYSTAAAQTAGYVGGSSMQAQNVSQADYDEKLAEEEKKAKAKS